MRSTVELSRRLPIQHRLPAALQVEVGDGRRQVDGEHVACDVRDPALLPMNAPGPPAWRLADPFKGTSWQGPNGGLLKGQYVTQRQ
jgi:hypothetical protein